MTIHEFVVFCRIQETVYVSQVLVGANVTDVLMVTMVTHTVNLALVMLQGLWILLDVMADVFAR